MFLAHKTCGMEHWLQKEGREYSSQKPWTYGSSVHLSPCRQKFWRSWQINHKLRGSLRWPYWLIIKSKLWPGLSEQRNQASRTYGVREFQFENILQRIPPGCLWILLQATATHFTRPCQNPKFKTLCPLPRLWVIKKECMGSTLEQDFSYRRDPLEQRQPLLVMCQSPGMAMSLAR